jgi:hypothetical protein
VGLILRICKVKDVIGIVLVGTKPLRDQLCALLQMMPLVYLLAVVIRQLSFLCVYEFSPYH